VFYIQSKKPRFTPITTRKSIVLCNLAFIVLECMRDKNSSYTEQQIILEMNKEEWI